MDYDFLKLKRPTTCVYDVDLDAGSINNNKYSAVDEDQARDQSRREPDTVFLMASVGFEPQASKITWFRAVENTNDMLALVNEVSFAATADRQSRDYYNDSRKPMFRILVNDTVEASAYVDESTDALYVEVSTDEKLVKASDIAEAKKQFMERAEKHGYHSLLEGKSFVDVGGSRFPYALDVPELTPDVLAKYDTQIQDGYALLGICHLYSKGACIARVERNGDDAVLLTYPKANIVFSDIEHAKSYTFGISPHIDEPTAKQLGIDHGYPVVISGIVDNIISKSGNRHKTQEMFASIASEHQMPRHQVDDAFWDVLSGKVYGRELRQHEKLKNLYVDIMQKTATTFPETKPVIDIWMARFNAFEKGVSPTTLEKEVPEVQVTTPAQPEQTIAESPRMRR